MKPVLALLVLLCASISLRPQDVKTETPPQLYTVPEAYEVYSTLLPAEWTWRDAHSKTLVIQAETKPYQMCLVPDAKSKPLLDTAITDYMIVNGKTWNLDRRFDIAKTYQLVPRQTLFAAFNAAGPTGWANFNAEHPDSVGWIELSAVGFNADKTVAVVYAGHHCGGLCGGGGFWVFQRIDAKWKPLKWSGSSCAWAS